MKNIVLFTVLLFILNSKALSAFRTLEADYITNVFSQSNFVKNPNARVNTQNVTASTGFTVARAITTPLYDTSEFNLASTQATGNVDWATRTFDAGMKGQNCEARFTYRGFTGGTTKAQIVQGANTVATIDLLASTDPKQVSINFPCGDLTQSTSFRIARSVAAFSGTNEIGGIYVGLATNMANVAQAEMVGGLTSSSLSSRVVGTANVWTDLTNVSGTVTAIGKATSASTTMSVTFANLPAGEYQVIMNQPFFIFGGSGGHSCRLAILETTSGDRQVIEQSGSTAAAASQYVSIQAQTTARFSFTTAGSRTFKVQVNNNGWTTSANGECYTESSWTGGIFVYRFPSSSELVVTPERQNWYISAYHEGGNPILSNATVASKTEMTNASLTLKPNANSQPVATLCASGNNPPALSTGNTTCAAGNESLGITYNIPSVGTYEVCATFSQNTNVPQNGYTDATFSIEETSTTSATNLTDNPTVATFSNITSVSNLGISNPVKACSNFNFTSLGQKAVRLLYRQNVSGTVTTNQILAEGTLGRAVIWTVTPVTNQSNSALYVQGPVLGAQTGAAIPSGYVGEKIAVTGTGITPLEITWSSFANTGVLKAGIYQCFGYVEVEPNSGSFSIGQLAISTSNNTGAKPVSIIPPVAAQYRTYAATPPFQFTSTGSTVVYANVYFQSMTGAVKPSVVGTGSGIECTRLN